MKIKLFQVDAFTSEVFGGNPAAVCLLDRWLDDSILQKIAAENNLAETAFVVQAGEGYNIRWFTPTIEVDLCGHATLATAQVLFHHLKVGGDAIAFTSDRSGPLMVYKNDDWLTLDFPVDTYHQTDAPPLLEEAMGGEPQEAYRGKTDYLLIYPSQEQILNLKPDMALLRRSPGRGVIVSAPGEDVDFVSRFFAPQSGIDEDPVTGSAHTTLTPYWSERLNKKELTAKQLSSRGGFLRCSDRGERIRISGQAVTYLVGEIEV